MPRLQCWRIEVDGVWFNLQEFVAEEFVTGSGSAGVAFHPFTEAENQLLRKDGPPGYRKLRKIFVSQ
jgi:hypothetical protein